MYRKVRKISLLIFIIFFGNGYQELFSQNWVNLGGGFNQAVRALYADSVTNSLYVGGGFDKIGKFNSDTAVGLWVNGIAQWKNNQWNTLSCGVDRDSCKNPSTTNGFPNPVFAITGYKNEIYVGGSFSYTGGITAWGIAKWNGTNWINIGNASYKNWAGTPMSGTVGGFLVNNNDLYVLGVFQTIRGAYSPKIIKYDGVNWTALPILDSSNGGFGITTAAFYKGELYVGGNFDGGTGLADIAKFNGTSWQTVGGGFTGPNTNVNKLYVWHNMLYVGGYFQEAGGDVGNNIAAWDSTNWHDLGGGCMPSNVEDMVDFNGYLYVCGQIDAAGGVPVNRMARWDGTYWCDPKINLVNGTAECMAVSNNTLYIGGGFTTINGDTMNNIGSYAGSSNSDTCGFISGIKNQVQKNVSILVYPNPSSGSFVIETTATTEQTLQVYDVNGKLVLSQNINGKTSINANSLNEGIYNISIISSEGVVNRRLVIVR